MIAAANKITDKPYIYAGGHGRWNDNGYDCSGSVSFALHGAGLLSSPEDSTGLESYGAAGPGKWVTIYANANHTWIVIAGQGLRHRPLRSDDPAGTGPRWLSNPPETSPTAESYRRAVTPAGLLTRDRRGRRPEPR